MENNKAVKKTGSAKLMHSIGFKVGIIISVLLLLILGIKATSDIIYSYTTTTKSNEENKLEETRRLAKSLEVRFAAAYQTGSDMQAVLQSMMDNQTSYGRSCTRPITISMV